MIITKSIDGAKPIIQQIFEAVKAILGGDGELELTVKTSSPPHWVQLIEMHGVTVNLAAPLAMRYTLTGDTLLVTLVNPSPKVAWKMFNTTIPSISIKLDEIFVVTASDLVPDLKLQVNS